MDKENLKLRIVTYCYNPKTYKQIREHTKWQKTDRTIRTYINELIEEEELYIYKVLRREKYYSAYSPSSLEILTEVMEDSDTEKIYKVFSVDPAFSGLGKSNWNTLQIHIANKATLQFLPGQLLMDYLTLQAHIDDLEKANATSQILLTMAYQRLHMHMKVLFEVMDQILNDDKFGSPEILNRLYGEDKTFYIDDVQAAWRRFLQSQLIEGDFHALDDYIEKDE